MISKYLLPTLAIIGALFGLYIVYLTQKEVPVPPIKFPPAISPYAHSIAGTGILEASSQNISVGTPFNEIITKIFVIEGDQVKEGDPLFQLDTRLFEAQLSTAEANLNQSKTQLEDKRKQFSFYERLKDTKSASEQSFQQARFALFEAEKAVTIAQATYDESTINIQRSIIKAPVDGEILQVNIHIGEIAPVIPFTNSQASWRTAAYGSLMLLGTVKPLQVRIDIDEDDAWRFKKNSKAMGYVRGNRNINFPLTYLRIEPYIVPKSSFTGQTVERVDTRVLQVLYTLEGKDLPIYPGQVIDVFIESEPIESL